MRSFALWVAVAWAAIATVYMLFGPVYATAASELISHGAGGVTQTWSHSWVGALDVMGTRALVPALVPVLLTSLPLVGRGTRARRVLAWAAAAALAAFCVLSVMTVGLFYLPSVVALVITASTTSPDASARPREASRPSA